MNKNLMLQGATKLNKNEMKSVRGGAVDVCGSGSYNTVCECSDKSAVWCGSYKDKGKSAVDTYCGGSGSCRDARN